MPVFQRMTNTHWTCKFEAMKKYAKARDWPIESEITEIGSGAKDRPKRTKLINQAKRRQIDVIIVWKLARFHKAYDDNQAAIHIIFNSWNAIFFNNPSSFTICCRKTN
ncbi:recombinase family protein [Legionella fallonii]|uniref:Resolvase/invertase-type recombinase catalytic domain-containing protein n=1 Tax=Legionella fallonii LLAP-10 TaxID=1212491 RepID=A0A098G4Y1_9GAMM|nr:recombinase family protein [Legionella fallonii]CEG57543.1 protein of unknown function [Resolvase, N-terminal domain] [Legionella fallonii LLAP-10]